ITSWPVRIVIRRCSTRKPREWILSILRVKRIHCVDDLGEIVFGLRLSGLVLNCFESGKEKTDQNDNDCDDDEQLDEGESACVSGRGTHGANPSRKLARAHVKSLKKLHRYNV